jgi:hypothetical protein
MCLVENATHATEEVHAMRTLPTQKRRLFSRHSTLATCLHAAAFLIAASAAAAQLTPASAASIAGKAYSGSLKTTPSP